MVTGSGTIVYERIVELRGHEVQLKLQVKKQSLDFGHNTNCGGQERSLVLPQGQNLVILEARAETSSALD